MLSPLWQLLLFKIFICYLFYYRFFLEKSITSYSVYDLRKDFFIKIHVIFFNTPLAGCDTTGKNNKILGKKVYFKEFTTVNDEKSTFLTTKFEVLLVLIVTQFEKQ